MPQPPRAKGHDLSPRSQLLRPPVGAKALSAWSLLPLRVFLGATFTYAGLQKLANPNFFDAKSPISIQSQLIAAARTSPIHALLSHLGSVAVPIGVLIAVGELAIGLGTLAGLFTRVAAAAGLLLSLSLFLTVSFHASPFFTGADIVFLFAWTPFIVAGGGSQLSMDAWIKERVAKEHQRPSPVLVPISFATVQRLCGHFDHGNCTARKGQPCDAAACPVLLNEEQRPPTAVVANAADRRAVVLGGALAAAVGTSVIISGAATAVAGRLIDAAPKPKGQGTQLAPPTTSPTTAPTTTSPGPTTTSPGPTTTTTAPGSAQGQLLGAASQVPKNQAASFTIPSNGDPGIVIHTDAGEFVGYDAVCPHTGCTVGYSNTAQIIVCPCHGSEFQVSNGDVIVGPAPHGLTKLKIVEGANGNLYLQ
ncbi:MAG TPA: Rieske 2Fe-2S domain-containing protein [Acidimicrobiales bacterium]|nr:Rieske 2Fe-2S domain-containing protein [Acidimicrobiales bacterium]